MDWQLMTANYVDTLWDNLTHIYCYSLVLMFMALKEFIVCPVDDWWALSKEIALQFWEEN